MRARNLKPGFFKNEDLADGGPYVQLLFEGLWCLADKSGRLEDRPRRIKAEIFPYYEVKPGIDSLLKFLSDKEFILRYQVGKFKLIQITQFQKHQNPHSTEKASVFPEPLNTCDSRTNNESLTVDSRKSNGGNLADSLNPDSLNHESIIDASPESPNGDNGDARPVFLCPSFEVRKNYFEKLLTEYPALSESILMRELNKMGDWLTDNPKKHKRTARGHIKNPKMFIRNWIERMDIKPGGDKAWYE